ncbi:MAG: helix-turn-helix domain-containing protein [Clostridiaceae bacterium]
MELNIHVIYDKLKKYNPELYTNYEYELSLKQVRIFEPSKEMEQDYLYLVSENDFSSYYEQFRNTQIVLLGNGGETDTTMSIIRICAGYSFLDIFQTIQDIFLYYEKWNLELLKSIASHKKIDIVAKVASQVLNEPFFLFDVAFKEICMGGNILGNYANPDFKYVIENGYLPCENQEGSKELIYSYEKCGRKLYPSIGTVSNRTNMLLNIFVNKELFAIFLSIDTMEVCSKGQISLMYYIRDLLELSFTSLSKSSQIEETSDYYIKKLLDRESIEESIINRVLKKYNWKIEGHFYVYTICNRNGVPFGRVKQEFCLLRLKENLVHAIILAHENYILIILDLTDDEQESRFTNVLINLLTNLEVGCVKSQLFERFTDLSVYYQQTLMTIKYRKNLSDNSKVICDFQSEYFSCISGKLSESVDLAVWIDPSVLKLQEYDLKHSSEYVKYLKAFLICGCNIKLTAQHLFFHRNTFVYRLEKIKQILGFDIALSSDEEKIQILYSCVLLEKRINRTVKSDTRN